MSWILIASAFLSLMGLGYSGLLVSAAQARRVKRSKRIDAVVAPYRTVRAGEVKAFRSAEKTEKSLVELSAALFGFDPGRLDQYPLRWWIVLGVTFGVARVATGFAVDVFGVVALAGLPVLWVVMCRTFFGWAVGRRQKLLLGQFPDVLAMIVRSVRVGVPVVGAITAIGREAQAPSSLEFGRLADDLAVGVPLNEATAAMAVRNGLAEYRFFATAIGLQAQTGGGLTATLENLADLIRKRIALRERGHALSSEARTSALILGGLPVLLGVGLMVFNPTYMSVLFTTGLGRAILGAALLSLACGAVTMQTIIRKTLS